MRYLPDEQVRERRHLRVRRGLGLPFPLIQYNPIERALERILDALYHKRPIDWSSFPPSSISKSICALEQLGFINRKGSTILLTSKSIMFSREPDARPKLFAEGALTMKSFAVFIGMLEAHKDKGAPLAELARQLKHHLRLRCADSTAQLYVKIMLDWARHAHLAPGVFAKKWKGPFRTRKKASNHTRPLFENR
ncbi:MAG: AAA-associated domain-containing protein [Planctomycetota bacterium]